MHLSLGEKKRKKEKKEGRKRSKRVKATQGASEWGSGWSPAVTARARQWEEGGGAGGVSGITRQVLKRAVIYQVVASTTVTVHFLYSKQIL